MNVLETMRQALEALEKHQEYIAFATTGKAITNLRTAIEQMGKQEPAMDALENRAETSGSLPSTPAAEIGKGMNNDE